MDCREIEFSPAHSAERINRASRVFPSKLLKRLLVFALHLLGAKRKVIATLVGLPVESVKTTVRMMMRDGFPALRDRRQRKQTDVCQALPKPEPMTVRKGDEFVVVDFGFDGNQLRIPISFRVQARTVLLSLVNAGLLPTRETAAVLGIHAGHCRQLARKLASHDVVESLVDKRRGQQRDYVVGSEQKAEIIQQLAARAVTGLFTSSKLLAEVVYERTQAAVSARTVRWHIQKLGLTRIKESLPRLVETLKKTHGSCS